MAATIEYFPFDAGPGADSLENRWRDMMSNMRTTGIILEGSTMDLTNNCAVAPDVAMQIQVYDGKAWVQGHMFQHTDDPFPIIISENISGDDRIDLVTIRGDWNANTITYNVIEGTPDPSPVAPLPIQTADIWDLPIAQVYVADGATDIFAADITDLRTTSNHASFRPVCVVRKSSSTTVNSAATVLLTWDTEETDPLGMHDNSVNTDRITIRERGFYVIQCHTAWASVGGATGPFRIQLKMVQTGPSTSTIAWVTNWGNGGGSDVGVSLSRTIELFPDDYLYVEAVNSSGGNSSISSVVAYTPVFSVFKAGEAIGI